MPPGGGYPPGGMPPGGGYPPPGPPQWGGQGPHGGPPQLPPKKGFPWALVVVVGFLVAVGVGAYIYKQAAGDPFKEWEQNLEEQTNRELEREMERMNDPDHFEKRMKELEEANRQLEELERDLE